MSTQLKKHGQIGHGHISFTQFLVLCKETKWFIRAYYSKKSVECDDMLHLWNKFPFWLFSDPLIKSETIIHNPINS